MMQPPAMAFAATQGDVFSGGADLPPRPQMVATAHFMRVAGYSEEEAAHSPGPTSFQAPSVRGESRLPFDLIFQTKAVGILIREPNVLADYADILKPGYFESGIHRYVVKLIFDYYRKLKTPPTLGAIELMISDECHRLKHSDELRMEMLEVAREAATVSLEESRYIAKRMKDFCRKNAAKELAIDLIQTIQEFEVKGEGDFDKIAPKLRALAAIGASGGRGTNVTDGAETLTQRLQNNTMYSRNAKIPTGLRRLDHNLDGGLSAGELAFVAAGPGVGKSTLLAQFGASALKAKFNVFVATMELKEEDYEVRFHQHLTGVGKSHVIQGSMRYEARKAEMLKILDDTICIIKYYPPGTVTVDAIRSFFSRVRAEKDNGRPWLIIIDYLEKLKMGELGKNSQAWELVGPVVNELIAFGYEFNAPVLTASQINRQGYAKTRGSGGRKHTGKEDIASSWSKMEAADLFLMFDQAELEKANGTARIRVEKCRRGKDGININVLDQRPIMSMIELDDQKQPILGYSPKRLDDSSDWLTLRPEWDQVAPYADETATGSIRPPQMEIDEYLLEQLSGLSDEQIGLDLEDVRRNVEGRIGGGKAPAPMVGPDEGSWEHYGQMTASYVAPVIPGFS